MATYRFMTPKGMYGGEFKAATDQEAMDIAEAAPWRENVLDIQESMEQDSDGNTVILLVVPDDDYDLEA